MPMIQGLDIFTQAYCVAALWSSTDNSREDGGDPLDKNYDVSDFAPEAMERIKTDCAQFQAQFGEFLNETNCLYTGCPALEYAGHDFWLTRNGHGSGFWDGEWFAPVGEILTAAAHLAGEKDIYVGDDGLLHFM